MRHIVTTGAHRFIALCMAAFVGHTVFVAQASRAADPEIHFNRDVRPILSDKCFHCHGPDEAARKAELRLDDAVAVRADRDGIVIVRPGDPAGSELIRRITSNDESEIMPPHESKKPLTEKEKLTLQKWVAEGAAWSQHWAFEAPVRHETPVARQTDWLRRTLPFSRWIRPSRVPRTDRPTCRPRVRPAEHDSQSGRNSP